MASRDDKVMALRVAATWLQALLNRLPLPKQIMEDMGGFEYVRKRLPGGAYAFLPNGIGVAWEGDAQRGNYVEIKRVGPDKHTMTFLYNWREQTGEGDSWGPSFELHRDLVKEYKNVPSAELKPIFMRQTHLRLAARLVARIKAAMKGVSMGETAEAGNIRVHRYRDSLHVWDLTNAGKRGKKVPTMSLAPTSYYKGDVQGWLDRMSYVALNYGKAGSHPYALFKNYITDLLHDVPNEIEMIEREERGIDVIPGGTKKYDLQWSVGPADKLSLTATPLEFLVNSSHLFGKGEGPNAKGFWQDTLYWPRKKPDAGAFYAWLKDGGESQIKRMSITDLRELWNKLGIKYDFH